MCDWSPTVGVNPSQVAYYAFSQWQKKKKTDSFQNVALSFLALMPRKLKKKREIYGNANNPPAFTNPVHGKLAGWIKEDKIANT